MGAFFFLLLNNCPLIFGPDSLGGHDENCADKVEALRR